MHSPATCRPALRLAGLAMAVTLSVGALSPPARAQSADAVRYAELMRTGQAAFEAANYPAALERFEAAHRLDPDVLASAAIARTYAWMRSCRRAAPRLDEVSKRLGSSGAHRAERSRVEAAMVFCQRVNEDSALAQQHQYDSDSQTATVFYVAGGVTGGIGVLGIVAGGIMLGGDDTQVAGAAFVTLGVLAVLTGGGLAIRGLVVDPDGPFAGDVSRARRPNGVLIAWAGHF